MPGTGRSRLRNKDQNGTGGRAFSAEAAPPAVLSGQLTANIAWSLEDDTLILSGTGELRDMSDWYYRDDSGAYADIPWSDSRRKIRKIVVRSGITSCGDEFCEGRSGLESVVLEEGFLALGETCFRNCTSLKEVIFPDGFRFMGDYCFDGCIGLKKLIIPESVQEISGTLFGNLPEGAIRFWLRVAAHSAAGLAGES